MKQKTIILVAVCVWLALLVGSGSLAIGQTAVLEISWWTAAGGGQTFSSGGAYTLGGTAGQAAAGGPFSGGDYTVQGGFWVIPAQTALTPPSPRIIYLPVVVAP
jgi:hypothetical protein